jgi:hypothetical protein
MTLTYEDFGFTETELKALGKKPRDVHKNAVAPEILPDDITADGSLKKSVAFFYQ